MLSFVGRVFLPTPVQRSHHDKDIDTYCGGARRFDRRCIGPGCRSGRAVVQEMPAVPFGRRRCQEQGRPGAQRARGPQVRHHRGLYLYRGQQEFGDHLERGYVQGLHQGSESQDTRHQNGFRRDQERQGSHRSVGLPQAVRSRRPYQMIKDVVVALSVGGTRDAAADYAISVAAAFEAHVTGVAFAYEPVIPGTVLGGFPYDFIEASRAESRKAAGAAVARFDRAANNAGVSAESRISETTLVGAAELFGRMARRFDLAVVAQGEPDKVVGQDLVIEAALFQSGRPVIAVPYIQTVALALNRVLVGGDGSQTAARAIGDAMPLLARAQAVDVVIVATDRPKRDEITGADMAHHLARHGLTVDVRRIVANDVDVANTLLSYAADSSADLIVMGGYGHSRVREFVLGGATRGILQAMTVPVLMSH